MSIAYEEIADLIENNRECVNVAVRGEGVHCEWIARAEQRLGILLPETYKWFLRNYGSGEIAGEEIFSIYEMPFEEAIGGDIVYNAIVNCQNGNFGIDKLIISTNGDEVFYFATSKPRDNFEYQVWKIDRIEGTEKLYADNFLEFLKKRITFLCL